MADFASALTKLWPNGDQKIPGLRAGIIASAPAVFAKYGVKDSLVLAHIMAQISHECGAGHDVVENLNYTAVRMTQVWPSRFPSVESAQPYAGNPRASPTRLTMAGWATASALTMVGIFGGVAVPRPRGGTVTSGSRSKPDSMSSPIRTS